MERSTIFSPDRIFRYTLWRQWGNIDPVRDLLCSTERKRDRQEHVGTRDQYCMFIGLNPSTADEVQDDATIRKCVAFSKRWGFGALCMTNLFAFRARDPKVMKAARDPIGPENDRWLRELSQSAGRIIAAWGTKGDFLLRNKQVAKMIPNLECLRKTQNGHPEHPCYITYEVEPIPFTLT